MEKRIFLITDQKNKGFMINAIIQELTEEGYEVRECLPNPTELSKLNEESGVYLAYLDGMEGERENPDQMLLYLKEQIVENEIALVLIGKQDDFSYVNRIIPDEMLAAKFLRPVNVKELGQKLGSIVKMEEEKLAKKRILVVDDDGMMLRTIKTWLSEKYQVYMVNSGMNAITFLAKNTVDLILLDYEMPVTTGPQVLEMLRSEPATSQIPVMFLTVKDDKESVMKVLSLKPEKYLLKTMPPAELIANIDAFFEEQRREKHF
ncbi:MAG: response regulator [Lachnospiraceae bacterium]|nr:response regulator [Lachnospiraceae bacterium]